MATTKFSDPTISKLISIAEDTRITDPRYRAIMPSSYGTLYELKQLSDELSEAQFEAAVNDGLLRPDIEREEVMALRGEQHSGRAKAKGMVLVTILLSKNEIDDADLKLLKSAVTSLLDCLSVTVEPSSAWKRLLAK
jgi:hypothetical protein